MRLVLACVAVLAALPAAAAARVKITSVRSTVVVVNSSGARAHGVRLSARVAAHVEVTKAKSGKAKLKKRSLTVRPKTSSLAPGRKTTVVVTFKGSRAPSRWKLDGTIACKARPAKRRGHTARQSVRCTIPKPPAALGSPVTTYPPPGNPDDWFAFAPFGDMSLASPPDFGAIKSATGVSHFTMAFVVAQSNPSAAACTPTWGGYAAYAASGSSPYDKAGVDAIRAAGGDVVASFGGQVGPELAIGCTSLTSLESAYRGVIAAYGLTHIDFDIEGAAVDDTTANATRDQAIAALQHEAAAQGRTLRVAFTIATDPSGIEDDSLAVLQDAIAKGVDISVVNVMAMDYGSSFQGDMGDYAVQAGNALVAKLASLYPTLSPAQIRRKVGVTVQIGANEDGEVFTLADRQTVLDWAAANHIGMLGMWSLARDRQCPSNESGVQVDCSGIGQSDWDFATTFNQYGG